MSAGNVSSHVEFLRAQAQMADERLTEARRLVRKLRRSGDLDLLPAVIGLLDEVDVYLFEIHTGTGNA